MVLKSSFKSKWLIFSLVFTMTHGLTNITFICSGICDFIDMSYHAGDILKYTVHLYQNMRVETLNSVFHSLDSCMDSSHSMRSGRAVKFTLLILLGTFTT